MSPNPSITIVNGLTFKQWFAQVDLEVQQLIELSVYDLKDAPSWDYWSSGYTPKQAAIEIIQNDDCYSELLELD